MILLIPNEMEAEKFFSGPYPSFIISINIWFPEDFIEVDKKSVTDDHDTNTSSLWLPPL